MRFHTRTSRHTGVSTGIVGALFMLCVYAIGASVVLCLSIVYAAGWILFQVAVALFHYISRKVDNHV